MGKKGKKEPRGHCSLHLGEGENPPARRPNLPPLGGRKKEKKRGKKKGAVLQFTKKENSAKDPSL